MALSTRVAASALRSATGNSGAMQTELTTRTISVWVHVSAQAGTSPTLDISVEWSGDGTNFGPADGTADTMSQWTTTGAKVKQFTCKARYYRVVWTIGGTESQPEGDPPPDPIPASSTFAVYALEN